MKWCHNRFFRSWCHMFLLFFHISLFGWGLWFFPADREMFSKIIYRLFQSVWCLIKSEALLFQTIMAVFFCCMGHSSCLSPWFQPVALHRFSLHPLWNICLWPHIYPVFRISCAVPLHHQNPVLLWYWSRLLSNGFLCIQAGLFLYKMSLRALVLLILEAFFKFDFSFLGEVV